MLVWFLLLFQLLITCGQPTKFVNTTCGCDTYANIIYDDEFGVFVNFQARVDNPEKCAEICLNNPRQCSHLEYNKFNKFCYFYDNKIGGHIPVPTQAIDCYVLSRGGRNLLRQVDSRTTDRPPYLFIIFGSFVTALVYLVFVHPYELKQN